MPDLYRTGLYSGATCFIKLKKPFQVLPKDKTYEGALCSMDWGAGLLLPLRGERIRVGILLLP
jgi:hypothetical protein